MDHRSSVTASVVEILADVEAIQGPEKEKGFGLRAMTLHEFKAYAESVAAGDEA